VVPVDIPSSDVHFPSSAGPPVDDPFTSVLPDEQPWVHDVVHKSIAEEFCERA
jgi:hypothetical protein